jgi:pterin-4a-carbinolamine dehydratase
MSETAVTSFVIRFKQEQTSCHAVPPWRGLIRHVQTSNEIHFTDFKEALSFMAQFVSIDQYEEFVERPSEANFRKRQ